MEGRLKRHPRPPRLVVCSSYVRVWALSFLRSFYSPHSVYQALTLSFVGPDVRGAYSGEHTRVSCPVHYATLPCMVSQAQIALGATDRRMLLWPGALAPAAEPEAGPAENGKLAGSQVDTATAERAGILALEAWKPGFVGGLEETDTRPPNQPDTDRTKPSSPAPP